MDTAADTEIPIWWLIEEHNSWEGETWFHFFLDGPDVFDALTIAVHASADLEGPSKEELAWPVVEKLANLEPGYMDIYWFGELRDPAELALVKTYELYKGKIRNYGEEMLERVAVE